MRKDGRLAGGTGWRGRVHNRGEWKKLLRTTRNGRILHMQMNEWMNEWTMSLTHQQQVPKIPRQAPRCKSGTIRCYGVHCCIFTPSGLCQIGSTNAAYTALTLEVVSATNSSRPNPKASIKHFYARTSIILSFTRTKYVNVKFHPIQATKSLRVGRGIDLPFHDLGT